jgi:hypothetical protein
MFLSIASRLRLIWVAATVTVRGMAAAAGLTVLLLVGLSGGGLGGVSRRKSDATLLNCSE